MNKKHFFLITFNITIGEFSENITKTIEADEINKHKVAHEYLLNYYADTEYDETYDNYIVSDGDWLICLIRCVEIKEDLYKTISQYVNI